MQLSKIAPDSFAPNATPVNNVIRAGLSYPGKVHSWQGFSHNWNLLLIIDGHGELALHGNKVCLNKNTLTLVSPRCERVFHVKPDWKCLWAHFSDSTLLECALNWQKLNPYAEQTILSPEYFETVTQIFKRLFSVIESDIPHRIQLSSCLIQEILLHGSITSSAIYADAHIQSARTALADPTNRQSMDEIANTCAMSRSSFYTKFKEAYGVSPRDFREDIIMRKVQNLLAETNLTLSEIAFQVHLNSAFYLSARFKKKIGISPTQFRQNLQP